MQVELRHGEAVDQTDAGAGGDGGDQRDDDRQRFQTREDLVVGDGHTGNDNGSQTDHPPGGNIGTGEHDTAGDAQGNGQLGGGQVDDVDDGIRGTVRRYADRDEDHNNRDDDVHGVVQQQRADGPLFVRRRHGLVGSHPGLDPVLFPGFAF